MKILFATDGSNSALAALDVLLQFPFSPQSQVLVTTVIDHAAFPGVRSGGAWTQPANGVLAPASGTVAPNAGDAAAGQEDLGAAEHALSHEAQAHLTEVTERLRAAGWNSASEIRGGHPIDQICESAETWGADLIVVGSHGLTGIRRHLLGSVSTGVLHYADCSVLLVPHPDLTEQAPRDEETPLRFLLAYDGSAAADKALELCTSLPLQGRATVTLLQVVELVTLYRQDLRQQLNGAYQEEKRAAESELDAAAEQLRQAGLPVEVKLLESGDLGRTILDTAAEQQSDLIVLGHKGRSAIKRMLVGSVISRIAAHATCALLIVR
jgi:nucleotide-binding universal stress UspA family protein